MITVIIPTYNRAVTIRKSVESVLNQTYSDFELIIVDDGSTDNTEEIIRDIQDNRLHYIKHTTNLGANAARNTGIDAAKGEYIAFQDSDDIWHKDKLKKQLYTIRATGADVVFCKYNAIYKNQKKMIGPAFYKEGFINDKKNIFAIGPQIVIGKSEVFKENHFDERMPRCQDFELMFRILKKYRIYCEDEVLVDYFYQCSDDAISSSPKKLLQACELLMEIHPDLPKKYHTMSYTLATLLLQESKLLDKSQKNSRKAMHRLALKYSLHIKIIIKYILFSMNITWERNTEGHIVFQRVR